MTHEDYETRYAEAMDVVRSKIPNVGQPETTPAGTRFVLIDGALCNDEAVFRMAWGHKTARDIVAQRWTPGR